jgi:hypothetical protein
MDEDASVVLELACLVFQHQKGSSWGFGFLFSFLRKYENINVHNRLS